MDDDEIIRRALGPYHPLTLAIAMLQKEGYLETSQSALEAEDLAVLCGPFANGIKGSKQVRCSCGKLVWQSPATQEMIARRKDRPTTIYCPACVKDQLKDIKNAH